MEHDHIGGLKQLLDYIVNIEPRYDELHEQLQNVIDKMIDLEHDFENKNFNACIGYMMAKRFQEIRKERRQIKNELALLEPLHQWYKQHKNLELDLFKVKKEMEKVKQQQNNWVYVRKVKTG